MWPYGHYQQQGVGYPRRTAPPPPPTSSHPPPSTHNIGSPYNAYHQTQQSQQPIPNPYALFQSVPQYPQHQQPPAPANQFQRHGSIGSTTVNRPTTLPHQHQPVVQPKGHAMTLSDILKKAEAATKNLPNQPSSFLFHQDGVSSSLSPMKRKLSETMQNNAPPQFPWGEVPENVNNYVQKCISVCRSKDEEQRMINAVAQKIKIARDTKQFYQTDWEALPVPSFGAKKTAQPTPSVRRTPVKQATTFRPAFSPVISNISEDYVAFSKTPPIQVVSKKKTKKEKKQEKKVQSATKTTPAPKRSKKAAENSAYDFDDDDFMSIDSAPSHQKRKQSRFNEQFKPLSQAELFEKNDDDELNFANGLTVQGTCQDLEKIYLRLTDLPEAESVRPENILKKSFKMVQNKWKASPDYRYTCEQLKSIRQDLAVQGIKNNLTVQVYEYHARIAIQVGDLSELNQCQTQLFQLYSDNPSLDFHEAEFIAYRILYNVVTEDNASLFSFLSRLNEESLKLHAVQHAIEVQKAVALNDYCLFFQLCLNAPNCVSDMLRTLIHKMRYRALRIMSKAYVNLSVSFIAKELGFDSAEICGPYVSKCGAVLSADGLTMDCKSSQIVDVSKQFIEVDAGVTHGLF